MLICHLELTSCMLWDTCEGQKLFNAVTYYGLSPVLFFASNARECISSSIPCSMFLSFLHKVSVNLQFPIRADDDLILRANWRSFLRSNPGCARGQQRRSRYDRAYWHGGAERM